MIKIMDIRNYFFSLREDSGIESMKLLRMSISSIWKNGFLKFHKFSTSFFFRTKKGIDFRENSIKNIRRDAPQSNISFGSFWLMESYISTESLNKPREYWKLCISNLKMNSMNFIGFIFRKPCFDPEASFGINKTCEIGKIFFSWSNCFAGFFKNLNG